MVSTGTRELAVLDQATRLLAEATSLDEIKTIRDKGEAARAYVKAARLGLELQNRAAELKLRAERKAGRFLRSMKLRGGDRKSKRHDAPLKLEDVGISRDQSRRWQWVASVPEKDFQQYLKRANLLGQEVTSAGLLRIARKTAGLRGDSSVTQPRPASGPDAVQHDKSVPDELILELTNHCRLLADVLRPLYEGGELQFKRGERRVVGRLLGEMADLITQLKREWPS